MSAIENAKTAVQDFEENFQKKKKKNQQRGNMTSTKDCSNCPVTNHRDMQVCELPNCCRSVAKSCLTL